MTRPAPDPNEINSGLHGWDALVTDILNAILKNPLPVAEYANFASLPTASSYDRCLAVTIDTNELYMAVSGTWKKITREA